MRDPKLAHILVKLLYLPCIMHNDSQSMCVANGYDTLYLCSNLLKPTSPQPPPGQIQIGDNTAATPSPNNHPSGSSGENFKILCQSDFIESLKP